MDDPQLQRLIELHAEQNQLLRKHLWRIRFSLQALLVLMTLVAGGLGVTFATVRSLNRQMQRMPQPAPSSPLPAPVVPASPAMPSDDPFAP
jgi:hypothetical protein